MIILRNIIPYEKDIEFDTKIAEITSISLEHEETTNGNEITGEFIISGDYETIIQLKKRIGVYLNQLNKTILFIIDNLDRTENDNILFLHAHLSNMVILFQLSNNMYYLLLLYHHFHHILNL